MTVSSVVQYKSGALTLGSVGGVALETYSNTYLATLSGNVGIGTVSPSSTLHVVSGNDGTLKIGTNSGTSAQLCLNGQCFTKTDLMASGGSQIMQTGDYWTIGGNPYYCQRKNISSDGFVSNSNVNTGQICDGGSYCYYGGCTADFFVKGKIYYLQPSSTGIWTGGGPYVQLYKIAFGAPTASVNIGFSLINYYGTKSVCARIYKNGAAYGTERCIVNGYISPTYSETLSFAMGDTIEVWGYSDNGVSGSIEGPSITVQ